MRKTDADVVTQLLMVAEKRQGKRVGLIHVPHYGFSFLTTLWIIGLMGSYAGFLYHCFLNIQGISSV